MFRKPPRLPRFKAVNSSLFVVWKNGIHNEKKMVYMKLPSYEEAESIAENMNYIDNSAFFWVEAEDIASEIWD